MIDPLKWRNNFPSIPSDSLQNWKKNKSKSVENGTKIRINGKSTYGRNISFPKSTASVWLSTRTFLMEFTNSRANIVHFLFHFFLYCCRLFFRLLFVFICLNSFQKLFSNYMNNHLSWFHFNNNIVCFLCTTASLWLWLKHQLVQIVMDSLSKELRS